jgi:hypothetical protein
MCMLPGRGSLSNLAMIYDVNSPQFQQFLRSSGRRKEGFEKGANRNTAISMKGNAKPAGAASTGL